MSNLKELFSKGVATGWVDDNCFPNSHEPAVCTPNHPKLPSYKLNKTRFDVKEARKEIENRKAKRELLLQQKATQKEKFDQAQAELDTLDKVQLLLQKTSEFARGQIKHRVEEIVTQALHVVFGKRYSFRISIEERANRVECDYYLKKGGVEVKMEKPDYDSGGGVVDVISVALHLAIGKLTGNTGLIFFDEVGKHISVEYAELVVHFLKMYSNKFDRQICLITQNRDLAKFGDVSLFVREINEISEVSQG